MTADRFTSCGGCGHDLDEHSVFEPYGCQLLGCPCRAFADHPRETRGLWQRFKDWWVQDDPDDGPSKPLPPPYL